MIKHHFQVGDRVVAKYDHIEGFDVMAGCLGTIEVIGARTVGVEWDVDVGGLKLDGRAVNRHGLWCFTPNEQLEIYQEDVAECDFSGFEELL